MTIQEAYEASLLAKAVKEARLGHLFLEREDAVMIHDTDYTNEPKGEDEKTEMGECVRQVVESVLGAPLPREVHVLVDPNAGARGVRCYCTSATYVVARTELK